MKNFPHAPTGTGRLLCAWCGIELPKRASQVIPEDSHGICLKCAVEQLAAVGIQLERDADGVVRPVPACENRKAA